MSEQAIPQPPHETNTDAKIIIFPGMKHPESLPQPAETPLFQSTLSEREIVERANQLRYPELANIDEADDEARHILETVLTELGLDIPRERIVAAERTWMSKQETANDRPVKIYGEFGDYMMEMLDRAEAAAGNSDFLRLIDAARKSINKNYRTPAIYAHRTAILLVNMELGDVSSDDLLSEE